ncbi:bifunctional (p)ppGpp synthetase/guanosine-3',5'-bis(diphosphate) 3'-pyrophosphohydrolase [Synechococcus sp. PCC 7336]|uniref:RelA/SpoT family protein n=1 Tax=Synechococcus sp. PCC 7336 TaxID=195250 RepID=UPI000348EA77|nr:bifunctional (p)ppGpp synthetase/guanosine-3',5'-bis(diphosphate) 3'-pyrophosphohydrolase [Synechococcus sp. PCC 7336]
MSLTATPETLGIQLPDWLKTCWNIEPGRPIVSSSRTYSPEDIQLICRAFSFARDLHEGQTRKSGEPYIIHPIQVAGLLWNLGGDAAMVASGFLHDVVEDTEVSLDEIEQHFGLEVRDLVDGVTKLSKFNFSSRTEQQAENFRRMFLAMAQDIRVIVVKLADRLHNMRTLEHLPSEKQQRIAAETKDIFAPLANRLGIWRFKWELEDLSFKYLEPDAYQGMKQHVTVKRTEREASIKVFIDRLQQRLKQDGLEQFEIDGRPKHLYSIYRKMQRQQKTFGEIYDLAGVRIIVNTNTECYQALATVHRSFRPIPGRFKDYIGLPKPNQYQSLHTAVIGINGRPVEVQIRTWEMHRIAEYGIAAHWKYKESGGGLTVTGDEEKFAWVRQLLEWQSDLSDAREYMDSVRENLFESEVYVFTPKSDLIALPRGSTPVDFAYRIHTEVGNHCAGARVNELMVPLDRQLRNGDIVSIITQKNASPSLDWVNFVATASARNRIRQWYKRSRRDENITRGRHLLERELGKSGLDALLKSERMQKIAVRLNYSSPDDLLAGLGFGETGVTSVVNKLRESTKTPAETKSELPSFRHASPMAKAFAKDSTEPIRGVEGMPHHIAKCCNPLPGEDIIGLVTLSGRGIAIHRQDCSNLIAVAETNSDRLLPVSWNESNFPNRAPTYPVELQVEAIDRVGVLKDILARLSDSQINVSNAKVKTTPGKPAIIRLSIDVAHKDQLKHTIARLRQLSDVIDLKCDRHIRSSR